MAKTIIATTNAPSAVGPYSQGTKSGRTVYCSGQLGLNPETGKLLEGLEAQSHQALKNLSEVLKAAGSGPDRVLKTTVFLADIRDFAAFNRIYAEYFKEDCPARSCIQVGALPLGGLVEVECIAEAEE